MKLCDGSKDLGTCRTQQDLMNVMKLRVGTAGYLSSVTNK